jgi:transposase
MVGDATIDHAAQLRLRTSRLGALPIVCHFLARMRVGLLLERYVPDSDPRVGLPAARAIGVLVRNLCVCRQPLYGLSEWAGRYDRGVLGLAASELGLLNDDRVGRALERLFCSDRASLLTELTLAVLAEFGIDCSQLHNDSTSISLYGEYASADGRAHHGKPTVAFARGHSKDHRPDLKQLLWILTVAADEAVPVCFRLADGNTNDESTHIHTWEELRAMLGRPDFLYVADCKLATAAQMRHIDSHGGRFVTKLPGTRKEDQLLRAWMRAHEPVWTEACRERSTRPKRPDEIWKTAPTPIRSTEGYRLAWVHSTIQQRLDEKIRRDRVARAEAALSELDKRLHGPKCRFAERDSVQAAIDAILHKHAATGLIHVTITDRPAEPVSAWTRDPDGVIHRTKTIRPRFALTWRADPQAIAHDAHTDGCYPLLSNDPDLTDAAIVIAYRYQPNIEKRHHQLKTIQLAAPVHLKNPARIESLFLCHYIALLCRCLIERHLRQAITQQQLNQLPLYPEHRACPHPTATRTLELFNDLERHHLHHHNGEHIHTFPPQLSPLQTLLLQLLNVPTTAYTQ